MRAALRQKSMPMHLHSISRRDPSSTKTIINRNSGDTPTFPKKRPPFFLIDNRLLLAYLEEIRPLGFLIYCVLVVNADFKTHKTFVKVRRISQILNCSESICYRYLKRLALLKLIAIEKNGDKTIYAILPVPQGEKVSVEISSSPTTHENLEEPWFGESAPSVCKVTGESEKPDLGNKLYKEYQESFIEKTLSPPSAEDLDFDSSVTPNDGRQPSRYRGFRQMLEEFWAYLHPDIDRVWDAGDGMQLAAFLRRHPNIEIEQFLQALKNFAESEVNLSLAPKQFLPRLHEFFDGPLDRFGKPRKEVK